MPLTIQERMHSHPSVRTPFTTIFACTSREHHEIYCILKLISERLRKSSTGIHQKQYKATPGRLQNLAQVSFHFLPKKPTVSLSFIILLKDALLKVADRR